MRTRPRPRRPFRLLASDTRGAALVEFAITLPILLLFFAMIVEGSRTFWSYQAAITGVRDAARYLARAADGCTIDSATMAKVQEKMSQSATGYLFLPDLVSVTPGTPTVDCVTDPDAPIATVSAEVTIQFPFSGIFRLVGGSLTEVTTTVTDSTRIYGT